VTGIAEFRAPAVGFKRLQTGFACLLSDIIPLRLSRRLSSAHTIPCFAFACANQFGEVIAVLGFPAANHASDKAKTNDLNNIHG